jgi:hypothetical protein
VEVWVEFQAGIWNLPPESYRYFVVAVRFLWSNKPESFACGSLAFVRVSLAGEVKDGDPGQEGPGIPDWRLRCEANNLIFYM